MISRRAWLQAAALSAGGAVLGRAGAQQPGAIVDTSNLFAMDQTAARSVRMAPKPGASPSMTPDERDALEHRIRCQCGCTLDVFTCRTTDFSCQVSPAMHRDIMSLVDGGYDAQEILGAFVNVYGDQALMAPPKEGFNLVGYVLPSIAIAVGAVLLVVMMRRWKREPAIVAAAPPAPVAGATADELRRLDAAVRDDS
jgi:cytochrome c-type biogenesis protein CcmH